MQGQQPTLNSSTFASNPFTSNVAIQTNQGMVGAKNTSGLLNSIGFVSQEREPVHQPNYGRSSTSSTFEYIQKGKMVVIERMVDIFSSAPKLILSRFLPPLEGTDLQVGISEIAAIPNLPQITPEWGSPELLSLQKSFRVASINRSSAMIHGSADARRTEQGLRELQMQQAQLINVFVIQAEIYGLAEMVRAVSLKQTYKLRYGDSMGDYYELARREATNFLALAKRPETATADFANQAKKAVISQGGGMIDSAIVAPNATTMIPRIDMTGFTPFTYATIDSQTFKVEANDSQITAHTRVLGDIDVFVGHLFNLWPSYLGFNPMSQIRIVSEYYMMELQDAVSVDNFTNFHSAMMSIKIFDYDQDAWVPQSFLTGVDRSHLFNPYNGDYSDELKNWKTKMYNTDRMFGESSNDDGNGSNAHFFVSKNLSGENQLVEFFGQIKESVFGKKGLINMAQSVIGKIAYDKFPVNLKQAIVDGLELRNQIINSEPTQDYSKALLLEVQKAWRIPVFPQSWKGKDMNIPSVNQNTFGCIPLPEPFTDSQGILVSDLGSFPQGFQDYPGLCTIASVPSSSHWYHLKDKAERFVSALKFIANNISESIPDSLLLNPKNTPSWINNNQSDYACSLVKTLFEWSPPIFYGKGQTSDAIYSYLGDKTVEMWNVVKSRDQNSVLTNALIRLGNTASVNDKQKVRKAVVFLKGLFDESREPREPRETSKKNMPQKDPLDEIIRLLSSEKTMDNGLQMIVTKSENAIPPKENDYSAPKNRSFARVPLAMSEKLERVLLLLQFEQNKFAKADPDSLFTSPTDKTGQFSTGSKMHISSRLFQFHDSTSKSSKVTQFSINARDSQNPSQSSKISRIGDMNNDRQGTRVHGRGHHSVHSGNVINAWPSFKRNSETVENHLNVVERMVAFAIMCTPSNGDTWSHYINSGNWPPFKIMLVRNAKLSTNPIIFSTSGPELGRTYFIKPDINYQKEGGRNTYSMTMFFHLGPVITNRLGIIVMQDFSAEEYLGGYASEWIFNSDEFKMSLTGQARRSKSLISIALPWNETPYRGIISLAGPVNAPSGVGGYEQNVDTYSTARFYDFVYHFSSCTSKLFEDNTVIEQAGARFTGTAYPGPRKLYTPITGGNRGHFSRFDQGSSPLSKIVYRGCQGVWTGNKPADPREERELEVY